MRDKLKPHIGHYTAKRISFRRRLSLESFDAVRQGHYMLALLELDVTVAQRAIDALRADGKRVSLFAFVAKCIATVLSEYPEFNAVRGGGRIYEFEDVDLNIPVEFETSEGAAPHLLVVRRAAQKSAAQIYADIDEARRRFVQNAAVGGEDRLSQLFMRVLLCFPRFVRRAALRALTNRPLMVKRLTGTAFLTSVAKFAQVRGFVIPYSAGPVATSFAVGGVVDKALVHEGAIEVRRCLQMTIAFNHDLVDGAPVARFSTRLVQLIEHPELIGMQTPEASCE